MDKAWEILWGEGIESRGLDPEAIRKSRDRLEGLGAAVRALGADLQRVRRGQQVLRDRARHLCGDELSRALIESHVLAAEGEEFTLERE